MQRLPVHWCNICPCVHIALFVHCVLTHSSRRWQILHWFVMIEWFVRHYSDSTRLYWTHIHILIFCVWCNHLPVHFGATFTRASMLLFYCDCCVPPRVILKWSYDNYCRYTKACVLWTCYYFYFDQHIRFAVILRWCKVCPCIINLRYLYTTSCCTDSRRHFIKHAILKFLIMYFETVSTCFATATSVFIQFSGDATFTRARFFAFLSLLQPLITDITHIT